MPALDKVETEIAVTLGSARFLLSEALRFGRGARFMLESGPGESVGISVGGVPVAGGRLVRGRGGRMAVEFTAAPTARPDPAAPPKG